MAPERVIDAPGLCGDFYCAPLAWSSSGVLAVALADGVHCEALSERTGTVNVLPDDEVANSVAWSGDYLVIGTRSGTVCALDQAGPVSAAWLEEHTDAVVAIACVDHGSWRQVATASADRTVCMIDTRMNVSYSKLTGSPGMAGGLAWSADGATLVIGGSRGEILGWESRRAGATHLVGRHSCPVKALALCPWSPNLVASGSGGGDGRISFWDACGDGTPARSPIDTGRQVTSLVWSPPGAGELLSAHGNCDAGARCAAISVWKCPGRASCEGSPLQFDLPIPGTAIVTQAVAGPDGTRVAAISATDGVIRVWPVWAVGHDRPPSRTGTPLDALANRMCNQFSLR